MLSIRLSEAIERVEFLGDLRAKASGAESRHGSGIVGEINHSQRAVREKVDVAGWDFYRSSSAPASIPAPATGAVNWSTVALPVDVERIHGVDLLIAGAAFVLASEDFSRRHDVNFASLGTGLDSWLPAANATNRRHRPEHLPSWCVRSMGGSGAIAPSSTESASDSSLIFFPTTAQLVASGNPQYVLHYTPRYQPVADSSHRLYYGRQSWFDWVCYDVAYKLVAIRDGNEDPRAQRLARLREETSVMIGEVSYPSVVSGRGERALTMRRADNY